MSATVEEFVERLARSGLLSAAELQALTPGREPSADARQYARRLVERGRLTDWQAEQILANGEQRLRLGNYVLLEKIGQGGMGTVFKAEHRRMQRIVALKMLPAAVTGDPRALERFRREIRTAARLEHPHIVTAYDADEADGVHFLVMQFVDGRDLSRLVRRRGPLSVGEAMQCAVQVAEGLQHAHEAGVIHRDLKPSNLIVDATGTVRILDLGLARWLERDADDGSLTETGSMMGTPDYVAPEQTRDAKIADARADLYSLGGVLYFALTGEVPFPGGTAMEKIIRHQIEEPRPVQQLRDDLSDGAAAVVERLLKKDPRDRFQTAQDAIAAMQALPECDGSTIQLAAATPRDSRSDGGFADEATGKAPSYRPGLPATHVSTAGPPRDLASQGMVPSTAALPAASRTRGIKPVLAIGGATLLVLASVVAWIASWPSHPASGEFPAGDTNETVASPTDWKLDSSLPIELEAGEVYDLSLSPDSRFLAAAGGLESDVKRPGVVQIWDLEKRRTIAVLKRHKSIVQCARFSPDGRTLATAAGDWDEAVEGEVILWDVVEQNDGIEFRERHKFTAHPKGLMSLVFHPAGDTFVTVGKGDGQVKLWNAQTGQLRKSLHGHAGDVNCACFSFDGASMATGGDDAIVRLWQPLKSAKSVALDGPLPNWVGAVAFSADGKRIAALSGVAPGGSAELVVWDVATRRRIAEQRHGEFHGLCLAFTPDGRSLITGTQGGMLRIWDAELKLPARMLHRTEQLAICVLIDRRTGTLFTGCSGRRVLVFKPIAAAD